MTILSQQALFSDKQAVTATAVSDNAVQISKAGRITLNGADQTSDAGAGCEVPLMVQVTTAFAGNTGLQVQLIQSDTVDGNGDLTSSEVVASSESIAVADLVAGYRFNLSRIPEKTTKKYIQLNYVVAGTATAGNVTAGLVAANAQGL